MAVLIDWTTVPLLPGIYKMFDSQGCILYVGKAKKLKNRLRNYFQSDRLDLKTSHLMRHVHTIETIVTQTENEALLLEAQLIKSYRPRYNISLKDDKHFPYVKLTADPFPRLLIVRQREADGARYFGPYPSVGSTKFLHRMLLDMFPLRDCKQFIPLTGTQPKCIKLDIHKCLGPCVYKTVKPTYDALTDQLALILSGKDAQFLLELEQEMRQLSQNQEYEKAAILRDRLHKWRKLVDKQQVHLEDNKTIHIWIRLSSKDLPNKDAALCPTWDYLLVQTFVQGRLLYQSGFYWNDTEDGTSSDFYESTILSWYTETRDWPDCLLTDATLYPYFMRLKNSLLLPAQMSISAPQKGERHALCLHARENASLALTRTMREQRLLTLNVPTDWPSFMQLLGLTKHPEWIFGFDVSHLQGQNIVASAVAFHHGKPAKQFYRRFSIRSVVGKSHDPASIYEAVLRRLQLAITYDAFLPDLLLIDGGKGQLRFATQALDDLGLSHIACLALAKKEEIVYRVGQDPVPISAHPALRLLQHVRDEAHRFALRFQRMKRRSVLTSDLSTLNGLGKRKIQLLYAAFGSIEKIREAELSALEAIPGIGKIWAKRIREHLARHDV